MQSEHTRETFPIFIQAMWRTGSTYLWKKFREQKQYRAYYEPLHECLLLPRDQVEELSGPQKRAELRHVPVEEFYFSEFPFNPAGGVELFCKSLSYESYCLTPGENDEPLKQYIANLIDYAEKNGQQPVFQFNRAMLRAGWLARNFGGLQILGLRNPRDVWKSFNRFAGNPFETRVCAILGQNAEKQPLKYLPRWIDFPQAVTESFEEEYKTYLPFTAETKPLLYAPFFDFYLVCILQCAHHADCVLDLDGISQDVALRDAATKRLEALGIDTCLQDCRLPAYDQQESDEEWAAYEQFSVELLKSRLPADLLLSKERFQEIGGSLGPYFRLLLAGLTRDVDVTSKNASDEPERKERHSLAIRLFQRGDHRIAAHLLGNLLSGTESGELWNDWATAQKSCGRLHLAELGFRQALRADVPEQEAGFGLGVLLFEAGKFREALPLLQAAELGTDANTRPLFSDFVNAARRELGFLAVTDARFPDRGRGVAWTIFLTGLSGAGKSTIAQALVAEVKQWGEPPAILLDGDLVRENLSQELGFSKEHRDMNILRIGFVAAQVMRCGGMAICAAIAPYDEARKKVRTMLQAEGGFCLVHVRTAIDVCEARDPKGFYAKARAGILQQFTGISDPYEAPEDAEISIDTSITSAEDAARMILRRIFESRMLHAVEVAR